MRQSPLLSIVVTSYTVQRLKDIYELLDSIKNQSYKNIEVIFVAERSRELYEKVKTYAEEKGIPNMVAVFNDGEPGQSPARNLGIEHTNGDIIGFVDDDVVLFPDWGEEMVSTYENDSVIGVTGPAFPLWEDESMTWLPEEFYWITSCTAFAGWSELMAVRTAGGMNMSFRREAFSYCRFSQDFGHIGQEQRKVGPVVDDAEFSINLRLKTGKLILYNPRVRVQHRVYAYRLSRRFVRGQAYWQGYSKALLRRIYRNDPDTRALLRERALLRRILLNLLPKIAVGFFSRPKLAWKRPSLTIAVLFHLTLGYFSAVSPTLGTITRKAYSSS
jgi:glycosyltransferase involved in cell wall biosynthesis